MNIFLGVILAAAGMGECPPAAKEPEPEVIWIHRPGMAAMEQETGPPDVYGIGGPSVGDFFTISF